MTDLFSGSNNPSSPARLVIRPAMAVSLMRSQNEPYPLPAQHLKWSHALYFEADASDWHFDLLCRGRRHFVGLQPCAGARETAFYRILLPLFWELFTGGFIFIMFKNSFPDVVLIQNVDFKASVILRRFSPSDSLWLGSHKIPRYFNGSRSKQRRVRGIALVRVSSLVIIKIIAKPS